MKLKTKILFSIPTIHHVEIALDELVGLQEKGFTCGQFPYAAQEGITSKVGRIGVIIKNALNLVKIARRFDPDVIYFNSRLEAIAGIRDFLTIKIFKTLYRKKVNFIIKSHGSDIEVLHSKSIFLSKIILPFLRDNVSAWLFLSSEEKRQITALNFFKPEKIFTTKNIVRTGQFTIDEHFREKHHIDENSKILLFVGRIIRQKGIFEVAEAFAKISLIFDVVLIVVGDGNDFPELKAIIYDLGIESKTILTGFIPEKDVVNYYSNVDILVFPTYFPEGFPMALFNSVAAGLAIVTTPTRAALDFLTEPKNCLWVEPQNSASVFNALKTLLGNHDMEIQMREINKQTGVLFSEGKIADELCTIIHSIISV